MNDGLGQPANAIFDPGYLFSTLIIQLPAVADVATPASAIKFFRKLVHVV